MTTDERLDRLIAGFGEIGREPIEKLTDPIGSSTTRCVREERDRRRICDLVVALARYGAGLQRRA